MKPRNIAIACGVAGVTVGLAAAAGIVTASKSSPPRRSNA